MNHTDIKNSWTVFIACHVFVYSCTIPQMCVRAILGTAGAHHTILDWQMQTLVLDMHSLHFHYITEMHVAGNRDSLS